MIRGFLQTMSDYINKSRKVVTGHRWQLLEMSDRGMAMYKVLSLKTGRKADVIIRSNAIYIYRHRIKLIPFQDNARILILAARDASIEKLATIFTLKDAAEVMAVFTLNRRALFTVVRQNVRQS